MAHPAHLRACHTLLSQLLLASRQRSYIELCMILAVPLQKDLSLGRPAHAAVLPRFSKPAADSQGRHLNLQQMHGHCAVATW